MRPDFRFLSCYPHTIIGKRTVSIDLTLASVRRTVLLQYLNQRKLDRWLVFLWAWSSQGWRLIEILFVEVPQSTTLWTIRDYRATETYQHDSAYLPHWYLAQFYVKFLYLDLLYFFVHSLISKFSNIECHLISHDFLFK